MINCSSLAMKELFHISSFEELIVTEVMDEYFSLTGTSQQQRTSVGNPSATNSGAMLAGSRMGVDTMEADLDMMGVDLLDICARDPYPPQRCSRQHEPSSVLVRNGPLLGTGFNENDANSEPLSAPEMKVFIPTLPGVKPGHTSGTVLAHNVTEKNQNQLVTTPGSNGDWPTKPVQGSSRNIAINNNTEDTNRTGQEKHNRSCHHDNCKSSKQEIPEVEGKLSERSGPEINTTDCEINEHSNVYRPSGRGMFAKRLLNIPSYEEWHMLQQRKQKTTISQTDKKLPKTSKMFVTKPAARSTRNNINTRSTRNRNPPRISRSTCNDTAIQNTRSTRNCTTTKTSMPTSSDCATGITESKCNDRAKRVTRSTCNAGGDDTVTGSERNGRIARSARYGKISRPSRSSSSNRSTSSHSRAWSTLSNRSAMPIIGDSSTRMTRNGSYTSSTRSGNRTRSNSTASSTRPISSSSSNKSTSSSSNNKSTSCSSSNRSSSSGSSNKSSSSGLSTRSSNSGSAKSISNDYNAMSRSRGSRVMPTINGRITRSTINGRITRSTINDRVTRSTINGRITRSTINARITRSTINAKITRSTHNDRIARSTRNGRITRSTRNGPNSRSIKHHIGT